MENIETDINSLPFYAFYFFINGQTIPIGIECDRLTFLLVERTRERAERVFKELGQLESVLEVGRIGFLNLNTY